MKGTTHEGSLGWLGGRVDTLSFGVSETQPVRLMRYRGSDKTTFWYDMHYSLELGILLSGKMQRQYRDAQIDLVPGKVWLCNIWEPHGFRIIQAPCEVLFFEIYPPMLAATYFAESSAMNWMAPFYAAPRNRPQASDPQARRQLLAMAEQLKPLLEHPNDVPAGLLRLKLLELLLVLCARWSPVHTPKRWSSDSLERMTKSIQMVFESKGRITTQRAASACGMNRNALSKLFSTTMGVGYSEFGLRYRISAVAEHLRTTSTPLKAIAEGWGFTDVSHMHRCFTRYYGCTPSDYRKRAFQATPQNV